LPAFAKPESEAGWHQLPILVVDDNATNRSILEEILVHWQLRPTVVSSGHDAMQMLIRAKESGTPFPLVLLDAQMPGMSGFDVAEQIQTAPGLAGSTIMMLSSPGQAGDAARCRELDVTAYLAKPLRLSELFTHIRNIFGVPSRDEGRPQLTKSESIPEIDQRYHILLVEDNHVNQKLAVRLLEKRGHRVDVAGNGLEAVAAFEREVFDLILMDIQMPEMNGYEATREIREQEKRVGGHIPIIAMTANAMKGDRERCLEAGMDSYVSKPIKPEELFETIKGVALRRRREEIQVA
jgi:CheY-like chemotaxis protein